MAKPIKLNDTLKISLEQGFPKELLLDTHLQHPYEVDDFKDKVFEFRKPSPRVDPLPPTRAFLVQELDGKWINWGHCMIIEQTIHNGETTSGKFKITKLHNPEYMKLATQNEAPEGQSYF